MHTVIHIVNKWLPKSGSDKTPYELWIGRSTNFKHFRVFGSGCYIKRDDRNIGKFDSRVDEGIFVGYSSKIKAYKCYNIRLSKVVESINVNIDESSLPRARKEDYDEQEEEEMIQEEEEEEEEEKKEEEQQEENQPEATQEEAQQKDNQHDVKTPPKN